MAKLTIIRIVLHLFKLTEAVDWRYFVVGIVEYQVSCLKKLKDLMVKSAKVVANEQKQARKASFTAEEAVGSMARPLFNLFV